MASKKRGSHKKKKADEPIKKFKNKESWAFLGILLLLSMMTIIVIYEGTITGNAVQTVSIANSGESILFEIKDISGLKLVDITFANDVKNGAIKFTDNPLYQHEGLTYSKFRGETNNVEIATAKITLALEKSKLQKIPISRNDIVLFLNNKELETRLTKIDGNRIYYEATTNKLGEFVIGRKIVKEQALQPIVEEQKIEEKTPPQPTKQEQKMEEKPTPESIVEESNPFTKIAQWFKSLFS